MQDIVLLNFDVLSQRHNVSLEATWDAARISGGRAGGGGGNS